MKRILLLLAAALGLVLLGRALVRSFASDETRIRWLVEDMADGFDRTRMDPILAGIADDFRDKTSGCDRQELRQAIAYLFFTAKDPATKRFPYRVEARLERLSIDRGGDDPSAECEVDARFLERLGDQESEAWRISLTARLQRGAAGWRIRSASWVTRAGRRIR